MSGQWDEEVDVLVVGFGGAGACAAIEAVDNGASVLALDRFTGGGATSISGGIVYAGGGTSHQEAAGFEDSVEDMLEYLRLETEGAVSDETLRRFCEDSVANLEWLESHGVPFDSSFCPYKTSYPTNDHYLYYSGNEITPPYRDKAKPAPRGHRVHGKGTSGKGMTENLDASARRRGVRVWTQTSVTELLTDDSGRVVGAECRQVRPGLARTAHRLLSTWNRKLNIYYRPLGKQLDKPIRRIEQRHAVVKRVRAKNGVVLAAGGFAFNRQMLAEHAPNYRKGSAIGTIGDDGSGIRLGESVGGATARMHRVSAWRFINPPLGMVKGVLVDRAGERFVNELMYGAKVGDRMVNEHDGHAYLVLDQRILDEAKKQLPSQTLWFQRLQMEVLFRSAHHKADSIAELAGKARIAEDALQRTVFAYNEVARAGGEDEWGKAAEYVQAIDSGPYYAFDCSLRSQMGYPCPMITLGGLTVEEESGLVTREDGTTIPGLYAAGRNASGICSESYVSGLSIADCVYSGRRAGRSAATAS
ncbi:FAD-binding protein [Saccharopolyspora karakumensis]|uniref:FAD-binding protein n=1 Tax=Saccharopolyspora karakumensis TaxID=2530386 RepID=A0A4R5BL28_9PSEU|nr:FAD-binding protein [Saccharopolyspora karakumensis]TDD85946.1 FAD-binding protein [Saccharopolyspora karakumensis]